MLAAEIACRVMATLWFGTYVEVKAARIFLLQFAHCSNGYLYYEFKTWGKTWCTQPFIQTNKRTSAGAIKLNTYQTKHVFKLPAEFWIVLLIIASSYN
jgi:hypothetical protein